MITFESLDVRGLYFTFCTSGNLQRIWVKFVYEGHWVKVRVAGAKMTPSTNSRKCETFIVRHNFGSTVCPEKVNVPNRYSQVLKCTC